MNHKDFGFIYPDEPSKANCRCDVETICARHDTIEYSYKMAKHLPDNLLTLAGN